MLDYIKFCVPNVNNIFGLNLWLLFSFFFKLLTGNNVEDFEFIPGKTFLADMRSLIMIVFAYYILIYSGDYIMTRFKILPFKFNFIFRVHNISLTIISLILLFLFIEQLAPILKEHGLFYAICNENSLNSKLVLLYYLNYLTKYIELLDTVFLVLKKKKLMFLHTYHHGATILLCYVQLKGLSSIEWVPITMNLAVHVVMYWYYYLSSCGIRVKWKKLVTRIQIFQFLVDLIFIYFATYSHFCFKYFNNFLCKGDCYGTEFAAIFGICIITSYLILFISFYIKNYVEKDQKKKI